MFSVVIYYEKKIISSVCRLFSPSHHQFWPGQLRRLMSYPTFFSLEVKCKKHALNDPTPDSIPNRTIPFHSSFASLSTSAMKKLVWKQKKVLISVLQGFLSFFCANVIQIWNASAKSKSMPSNLTKIKPSKKVDFFQL